MPSMLLGNQDAAPNPIPSTDYLLTLSFPLFPPFPPFPHHRNRGCYFPTTRVKKKRNGKENKKTVEP